jgi:reverse transcriptase-like protein
MTPELLLYLKELFKQIIKEKQISHPWKKQNIFPISKKIEWKFNIQETRPISLIDSFRKIFTKILVNRLSEILTTNKILQGNNFAGLPFQGTFQPLQILNSIYNIAKLKKEELWILSLDIKSAFDSINTTMLTKSMKRIKIP